MSHQKAMYFQANIHHLSHSQHSAKNTSVNTRTQIGVMPAPELIAAPVSGPVVVVPGITVVEVVVVVGSVVEVVVVVVEVVVVVGEAAAVEVAGVVLVPVGVEAVVAVEEAAAVVAVVLVVADEVVTEMGEPTGCMTVAVETSHVLVEEKTKGTVN